MTNSPLDQQHFVILHAGALGDFVLTWPLLRSLLAQGAAVTLIAAPSHGRLAARVFDTPRLDTLSKERSEISHLWADAPVSPVDLNAWSSLLRDRTPSHILSFIGDDDSDTSCRFRDRLRASTRTDRLTTIGPPGSASRRDALVTFNAFTHGAAAPRPPGDGPAVLHIGAGARDKQWPLDYWRDLIQHSPWPRGVRLIGGEVEAERLSPDERHAFNTLGGVILSDLDTLLKTLLSASVFIGADTGPTHLAAQLGLPTIALFGPTDPAIWSPIGPDVHIIRSRSHAMHDLTLHDVNAAVSRLRR